MFVNEQPILAIFESLTFAKSWLACRAKGNFDKTEQVASNMGWLSAIFICLLAKKLNLLPFIVIFFIFKLFSLSRSPSIVMIDKYAQHKNLLIS